MGAYFSICFYMFICTALLMFNVVYILRSKGWERKQCRKASQWLRRIDLECSSLEQGHSLSVSHGRYLEKRLTRECELMAYQQAMDMHRERSGPGMAQRYLDTHYPAFLALAVEYGKRSPMERAYYAHLMAVYHPGREKDGRRLREVLFSYLDDSTVFCRENVLQALYAMGDAETVERAFVLMSQRGWYHHVRLLSDGMTSFAGDKESLAWRLWRRISDLSDCFQVAVVLFAANVSGAFSNAFLTALAQTHLPLELRFALIRYFQRHHYPPAKPLLLSILSDEMGNGLSIAAAASLLYYPGEDTKKALLIALGSRNWYVRRNAAASLVRMGGADTYTTSLRESGDPYAVEMLEYMLEQYASSDSQKHTGGKEISA